MRKLYVYRTTIGSFYIVEHEGKFHPMFSGERLGSYETPQEAAENLAGGHTFSIGGVKDISTLAIPSDLTDWSKLGYKLQNVRDLLSPATRASIMNQRSSLPRRDPHHSSETQTAIP